MGVFNKIFLGITAVCTLLFIIMIPLGRIGQAGPVAVTLFTALALFFMGHKLLKSYAFSVWVFASVAASMYYPEAFGSWFGKDLAGMITPLIQIIMFGMGTTLNEQDFIRVFKMPLPILLTMALQFGAKPIIALGTAMLFGLSGEIAAGVVLIGSVPGGVASNLMTYLAGGDVCLSVTMTSCSTLISPVMTPFVMQKLGGKFISIQFITMMFSILNMVIVPTLAGIIANKMLYGKAKWSNSVFYIAAIGIVSAAIAIFSITNPAFFSGLMASLRGGVIIGGILLAVVSLSKLIVSMWLHGPENWMDKVLPLISMMGIVLIIAIITSRSADQLVSVGMALIVASCIQIFLGYLLGYWGSRLLRFSEKTARTVSIEVGLQNGGMASALAINVLKSAEAALASAIYGPLMNVSGSLLSSWWHKNPPKDEILKK